MTTESSSPQAVSQPERLASPEEIAQALETIKTFQEVLQQAQRSAAALTTVLIIGCPYMRNGHNSQASSLIEKIMYFMNHPGFCFMESLKSLSEDVATLLGWLGVSTEGIWLSLQSAFAAVLSTYFGEQGGVFLEELLINFSELQEEKQLTPSLVKKLITHCEIRSKMLSLFNLIFSICETLLCFRHMDLPLIQVTWNYACALPTLFSCGSLAETQIKTIYRKLYAQPKCTRAHLAFINQLLSYAQYEQSKTLKKSLVHVTFKEDDTGIFVRALDAAGIIFYGNLSQGIAIPISANHRYSQKDFDELFSCFQKCYEEETHATAEMSKVWNKSQKFSSKLKVTLEKTLSCQNIRVQNLMDLETAYELHLLKYRVTVNPADFNEVADYLTQLFRTDPDPAANTIDIILRNCTDFEEFDHGCEAINQRFKVSKWLRKDFLPAFSEEHNIQDEWRLIDHQWPITCRVSTRHKISHQFHPEIRDSIQYSSAQKELSLAFSKCFQNTTWQALAAPNARITSNIMKHGQFRRVSPSTLEERPDVASGSRDPITAPSVTRYFLNGKELDPHCVTTFRDHSYCAVYIRPEVRAHFAGGLYQPALEVFQEEENTHFTHDGHGKGACWLKRESRPTLTNGLVISMKSHHPASEARIFFTECFGEYERRSEKHSMRFFTPVAYGTHQKIKEVLPAPLLLT